MPEKPRSIDDEEYFKDLATPLPGHRGNDGNIKDGKQIDEVAGRIAALAWMLPEQRDRLAPKTLEMLQGLYGKCVVDYINEIATKHNGEPDNFYERLLGYAESSDIS